MFELLNKQFLITRINDMNDVELRWLRNGDGYKLQYRVKTGESYRDWSEWREVPTVEE